MKNRILFDLIASQPANGAKFHGGGEYIKTVFKYLCDNYLDEIEMHVSLNRKNFMDEWVLNIIEENGIVIEDVEKVSGLNHNTFFLNANVFFLGEMMSATGINIPSDMFAIGVYHGLRTLERNADWCDILYGESTKNKIKTILRTAVNNNYWYNYKYNEYKTNIEKFDIAIGVSEHSYYAARNFFPDYPKDRLKVFYSPMKYIESIKENKKIAGKIILMVSVNRYEKNAYRALKAMDDLFGADQLQEYKVVTTGVIPKSIENRLKNKDRFISRGYVEPNELEELYQSCDVFVYPTKNEGFGYPPLEAMKYGKTCVVSACTSLPEICGDAVYYVNPYDIKEMKTRILQAVDKKIPKEKIERNLKRVNARQEADLKALCDLIVYGSK